MKSPSSMRIGRFYPSKCRGKVQKMRVLYTHSLKLPGPSPSFLIIPIFLIFFFKTKKIEKGRGGGRGGKG
jgi:hypothetical protein